MPMDEGQIIESKKVETPAPEKPKINIGDPQPITPDKFVGEIPDNSYMSIAGFLSADIHTDKDKLTEIYQWARNESNSDDKGEILWTLKGLESKLGIPKTGQSRVRQLLNWVRLDRSVQSLIKERGAYER